MKPFKENLIRPDSPFPVDVFIQDNLKSHVVVNPHWHDCVEILYMLEGNAKQQVNEKFFEVTKDDIIILNEGDIHSTACAAGEDTRILVIKFLSEVLNSNFSRIFESKYILTFLHNRHHQIYHISHAVKNSSEIYHLMMGIYNEFLSKDTGYEIFIKGYIYQLIAYLIRNDMLNIYKPITKEMELKKLDKLLKYVEEHFYEEINLNMAAQILNMSYYYLSRYFKRTTGRNFKEYIDFVKVCEAEKLLLSGEMNISRIAYEVGFSNVSSFNRVFKRIRGYPPGTLKRTKTAKK